MSLKKTKDRLLDLFKYIKALNEIRNPIRRDVRDEIWNFQLDKLPDNSYIEKSIDKEYIIKIKKPILKNMKEPPLKLRDYLNEDWSKWDKKLKFSKELEESLKEDFEIKKWLQERDKWCLEEKEKNKALKIFDEFYKLYSYIQKEPETFELILGDGLLYWNFDNGNNIYHPVLLQQVKLIFNSTIPEFKIILGDKEQEVYASLFRNIENLDSLAIKEILDITNDRDFDFLDKQSREDIFKRLSILLSPDGQYIKNNEFDKASFSPQIKEEKIIFLRRRNLGFNTAIESIIEDIPNNNDIPTFLKNIVGINDGGNITFNKDVYNINGEDEDILLTKPANKEQLAVAKQLERKGAVLVQGPPGTGKTHTIANLIGHLLSQGKNILVTSHSEKALSVLKDKVVPCLQPLCLSILSSSKNKLEMEKTFDIIDEKRSSITLDDLTKDINDLTENRSSIINNLNKKRLELKNITKNEYRSIVIAGEEYTPIMAAKFIKEYKDKYDVIPSPILLGHTIPVSYNDLDFIYSLNDKISKQDEEDCLLGFTDINLIPSIEEFTSMAKQKRSLIKKNLTYKNELWRKEVLICNEAPLEILIAKIYDAIGDISDKKENLWILESIYCGYKQGSYKSELENLIEDIKYSQNLYSKSRAIIIEYNPKVKSNILNEDYELYTKEIIDYLKVNGKISKLKILLKKGWREVINNSTLNGVSPKKLEDFIALNVYIKLMINRNRLSNKWDRKMAPLGMPKFLDLDQEPEEILIKYADRIVKYLNWYEEKWIPIIKMLKKQGFRWEDFLNGLNSIEKLKQNKYDEILDIKNIIAKDLFRIILVKIDRVKYEFISRKIQSYIDKIENHSKINHIILDLKNSMKELNIEKYKSVYGRLIELNSISKVLDKKEEILLKIQNIAPNWAIHIRERIGIHGKGKFPCDYKKAWLYRQLNDELDNRSNASYEDIENEILKLQEELKNITILLAEKKAWKAKFEKITFDQLQAINGWRLLMKSIGSRNTKRAPKLLADARSLMPICQSAIPVWIMPINRVVETFNPKENKFDVVIIDEASQADILALTAIYLGKQIIIVGDKEQVSPIAVGQNLEEVDKLIDTYLVEIPNRRLYTGRFSIYDLAQMAGFQPICLKEHYRCVTPIIQFCNYLSYNGKIKPLRDSSELKCKPHTVAYRVENGECHNKLNKEEAKHIASLIISCTEQEEYKDKSFGVISLVGEQQAVLIDDILRKFMDPSEYIKRKIQCGNAAHFQGDERDIVFLSMVDSPEEEGPLYLKGFGPNDMIKKRYNVAVSRAGEQLWVVYSLNPDMDLKKGDIRLRLINHVKNPYSMDTNLKLLEQETESEFERMVLNRLVAEGYKVVPQWKVGSYRIDMVVEGGGKKLAIECDGERWHKFENLEDDMNRQAILERLGWRFERIRGSAFFKDPDKAMEKVFNRIEKLNIPKEGLSNIENINNEELELKNRIIRRANEIRLSFKDI